jgi:aspartate aminotransferase
MLLYMVMASFKRANLLLPSPAWVSYEPQAHLLGHSVTRICTTIENRWRLTPEGLDEAAKRSPDDVQKILILNTPGNPDGLIYEQKELKELANIMRKWNILVIADEIYALLTHNYSSGIFTSLAAYYPERTLITTGLSKWSGAGGWRLGLLFLPEQSDELKNTLLGVASETYSCAPSVMQKAAMTAYIDDDVTEVYLQSQRNILRTLSERLYYSLNAVGIGVHRSQGGFYLFLDFRPFQRNLELKLGITTSESLCEDILNRTGVALLPSNAFGFPLTHLSARLAYVDFDGDAALSLAARDHGKVDDDFVYQVCGDTIEGVERLCEYFTSTISVDHE